MSRTATILAFSLLATCLPALAAPLPQQRFRVQRLSPTGGPELDFLALSSNYVAFGGRRTIHVWELGTDKETVMKTKEPVSCLCFAPDGKALVVGQRAEICFWDWSMNAELKRFQGHRDAVSSLAFSADGKRLASTDAFTRGDHAPTARLWAATGQMLMTFSFDAEAYSILFAPDGNSLITSHIGRLHLSSLDGKRTGKIPTGAAIKSLAISNDGRFLSGVHAGGIRVWEMPAGKEWLSVNEGWASGGISPSGKLLAFAGRRGAVRVFSVATKKELLTIEGTYDLATFGPGDRLAYASRTTYEVVVQDLSKLKDDE